MKAPPPLLNRYSSDYWRSEVTRAEERQKKFLEYAEESIRVYNAQKQVGILNDTERRLNCWWYCVNTLLPAYYSSTPKAEVLLRKRSGGLLEEVSATILERNVQYHLDMAFPFDQVGYNAALQFLLTGRAVLWARYRVEFETEKQEIALFKNPQGQLIDDKGQPFQTPILETKPGPGGLTIATVEIEEKGQEYAILDVVQYNDYLSSDARNETEVEWRARKAYVLRAEAEEMFGKDIANTLYYDSFPDRIQKDWNKDYAKFEGKAEIYEIWCKASQTVYWGHKSAEKFIIHESEPPIEYPDFFPCSVITASQDPDSVLPVSDYAHCKDQILEIERLTTRIHAVTQAIRTNALYDSGLGLQVEQLMIGDLKMIPTMNWPSYKSKGGLQNSIEFMDIAPFVNALQQLQAARQQALEQLYETLKVSDLLRGSSEQYKSATANRLEAQWSSLGLIVRQNMFAKFISNALEKVGIIIAQHFDVEDIFDIADADRIISPLLPEPPQPQMGPDGQPVPMPPPPDPQLLMDTIKQKVINLYRNDDQFNYRIQITSDSMVAVDQAQQQQEGAQLLQTCGDFFAQMKNLIEQYPPLLGFSIELFQNMIKRFKGGKELDGIFTKALQQIGDIAKAKEEAAKQPPPPDPKTIEMQTRLQIAQMESQAKIQAVQLEMQDSHEKNMLLAQDQQVKMQREQLLTEVELQKAQLQSYVAQQELAIKQQEIQIKANAVEVDMMKVQAMDKNHEMKAEIATENNRMQNLLKMQEMEAKHMEFKLAQQEKVLEETRLTHEQQIERVRLGMEALQKMPHHQSPIIVQTDKPMVIDKASVKKKRRGTIVTDHEGNPVGIDIEDVTE